MTLTRITSTLAAMALGGVVVATTYGAQAADSTSARSPGNAPTVKVARVWHFQPPPLHKYGPNGMRLGLHCETKDMS